jgi:hypothetical protein
MRSKSDDISNAVANGARTILTLPPRTGRVARRAWQRETLLAKAVLNCAFALVLLAGTAHGQVPSSNDSSDASFNTGVGGSSLGGPADSASGGSNTALGNATLYSNTGNYNTAAGASALLYNGSGSQNTAVGAQALYYNSTGYNNTALGYQALMANKTGIFNTAGGIGALASSTAAAYNTAFGSESLNSDTTGGGNAAFGTSSLVQNRTGNNNSAFGLSALSSDTGGSKNTALGANALFNITTGSNNIGIGYQAGYYPLGSNNIEIGSSGAAVDSAVIRIGVQGTQKKTYLAGVRGTNVTGGVAVMVTSAGQLGVVSSSIRYKEDVRPMGNSSDRLLQLRPVSFRYKQPDEKGQKPVQYGLIAEEVAQAMPELVVYNDKGQPETVAYQTITPMLLNELQKEHGQLQRALNQIEKLQADVAELRKAH